MFFALFPCFACIQSKHGVLQINAPILLSTQIPDQLFSNSRCFALLEALNATTPTGWWAKTRRWTEVTTVFEFSDKIWSTHFCVGHKTCVKSMHRGWSSRAKCAPKLRLELMLCGWRLWSICQYDGWVKPPAFQHQFMQGLNIHHHPFTLTSYPAIQLSWWLQTKGFQGEPAIHPLIFSGCIGGVRLCQWMPKQMSLAIRRKSKIFASSDTMFSLWRRTTQGEQLETIVALL